MKKRTIKGKWKKHDNLDNSEKRHLKKNRRQWTMHRDEEQLRKYMKKVKKDMHDNLGHGEKEQIRKNY